MPDIITTAERDQIAAFLASNPITKCPPRFAEPVTGAAPMTDGIASSVREKTAKEMWSEAAEMAKKRKAADRKKKLAKSDERRAKASANQALVNQRASEAIANKLGKILRFVGDEWTWPRLREAAKELGYKAPKIMTQFLREQGHGDKIPPREYAGRTATPKPQSEKPKQDKTARYSAIAADYAANLPLKQIRDKWGCGDDTIFRAIKACDVPRRHRTFAQYDESTKAGILADYDAMVSFPDMVAKWRVADDTIKRIAEEAGRQKRPRVTKKTGHIYAARLAERDQQIRADYDANVPMDEMMMRWGMGKKAIFESAKRAGATKRKTIRKRAPASAKDLQIAAMYQGGAEVSAICADVGTTPRTVYRALARCKVTVRDGVKTREQIKREAAAKAERVIALHQQGKTTRQIMQAVGYLNESVPRRIVAAWKASRQNSIFAGAAE